MNRREFAQLSLLGLGSAFLHSSCAVRIPQTGSYPVAGNGSVYLMFKSGANKSILRKVDLDSFESFETEVPLGNPHSVARRGDDEIMVFDFLGSAAKVSLSTGEAVVSGSPNKFLGHGVYAPDSDFFWSTEEVGDVPRFRARSGKDLGLIKGERYSLLGGHHLVKLPGSGLLVSYGYHRKRHVIYFYDPIKLQMVNEVEVRYAGVHLLALSASEVVMATTEKLMEESDLSKFQTTSMKAMGENKGLNFLGHSPVVYANSNGAMKEYWDPSRKDMFRMGFGLDRVQGATDSYLTSHFLSNKVILWKGDRIERTFDVPGPLVVAVTNDAKRFVVQSEHRMKVYSLASGELVRELKYESPLTALSRY